MRLRIAAAVFAVWGCLQPLIAQGQSPQSFPRVIGPTGQPYGPTQAHYQYFRRYGVPYNGYTGLDIANGYPAPGVPIHGGYGPPCFGPSVYPYGGYYGAYPPSIIGGPIFVSPLGSVQFPNYGYYGGIYGGNLSLTYPLPPQLPAGTFSPLMEDSLQQERDRWQRPLVGTQPAPDAMKLVPKSTPEAQLRSVKFEAQGDREVQGLKFTAATASYTQGIRVARDRIEPRVKLALTLASRQEYSQAAHELKLALALDPNWPAHALKLDDFFGEQNHTAKVLVKERTLDWAKDDIRDPDRLFLMGALLHFDGDARGITLIETAARLQGPEPHLMSFLAPEAVSAVSAISPVEAQQVAPNPAIPETPIPTSAEPDMVPLPELPALPSLLDQ